jgi:pimeloyl-ACP methyl ester carboxylesterase
MRIEVDFFYKILRGVILPSYLCLMKSSNSRIEVLKSAPHDGKEDRLPEADKRKLRLARLGFQTIGRIFPTKMAELAYRIFATPRWRAQHLREDSIIQSAKKWDFIFRDFKVKVYEWGNPDARIVLLAHGWESRGTALRMYVKPLLAQGFRVVAFDSLGHGDSEGERNNLSTNAKLMAEIVKHYGGIYGCIGHSFGCSSLVYMLQHVDNQLVVERVVFLAVPHGIKKIVDDYFTFLKVPKQVQQVFYRTIENINSRPIEELDVATAHASVKVGKLLLVHDRFDDVTSLDAAERVVERWGNSHLIITEGYGHFRLAKNPDVIMRIVDFISVT